MKIILATQNLHKVQEIQRIWQGLSHELLSLKDFPQVRMPEEDGQTFQENALIKARSVAQQTGYPCVADDSGFVVHALQGRPGIYSARYAGQKASDGENLQKVLKEYLDSPLKNIEKRAAFVCAVAWVYPPKNEEKVFEASVEGEVSDHFQGTQGFGYDPLFFYPPLQKTFAQISMEEKNELSHRGKAFRMLKNYLLES